MASFFEHPVQSLYAFIRHYKALCRVYHSEFTHFIGVCDPLYEIITILIWRHDDIGVLQESPQFVGGSQLREVYALYVAPCEFTSDTVQIGILRKFKLI
jgi:hypothetical protein